MNVGGHAILCLAFSFQLCGFECNESLLVQETKSAKDLDLTCSATFQFEMPHAYKWDPCPWIGLLILLADLTLPDPRFLLRFPAANNNSVLFQLQNAPA